MNKRQPRIASALSLPCTLMAVLTLLGLGCGVALAETARLVYLPITFPAEAQDFRTTACLQVNELVYPHAAWWEESNGSASASERAFKAVIAAIKHKDRAALLRLADPKEGRDPKRFEEQAGAFFQQFELLEVVAVPRAYEFDGLAVFFAKVQSKDRSFFAPFLFVREDDGSFGFLPYRTEKLSYLLVKDWFDSAWGPSATDKPVYCTDENIKHATHRVALDSSSGAPNQTWLQSFLFLKGASFDKPGELGSLVSRVKSTIGEMKTALLNQGFDEFAKHLTLEGANRAKQWFATAGELERSNYKSAITQHQPFFLFDASPLLVVFVKTPAAGVQVMYLTATPKNELVWTNSSHVTVVDRVFKRGPLYEAASLGEPFSKVAVK